MILHLENATSRRFWISSVLLLAQLLTVGPILLIVSSNRRQSALSQRCVLLLQQLDQLAVPLKEMENTVYSGAKESWPALAWQIYWAQYRDEVDAIPRSSSETPEANEILLKVDVIVNRMAHAAAELARANGPPQETRRLIEQFLKDDQAALAEISATRGIVRSQLSSSTGGIAEKSEYLNALVAAACLLTLGVIFVFRSFRHDSATQRRLEQTLRTSNDEVIAALVAARDGSDAKNEALINVSDALRTPLDGMICLTRKLLETELDADQRDCAQANLRSALFLASVTRDIQDFAKMESGRLDLEVEEFRPTKVIEETLDAFRIAATQKGLKLESVIAARLPALARGDAGRLRQILTNLMDNAVKFTERGWVSISATDVSKLDGRIRLRFEIKDTGIGISDEVKKRLFEPLPQVDKSTNPEHLTTGLGLAISKKLVEMMGGEIEAASSPGSGSIFWFTIALEHMPANHAMPEHSAATAPAGLHHGHAATHIQSPTARTEGLPAGEKRREVRYRVNYPTILKSKTLGVALVRILDVSRFGLRVSVPFRLPHGTEVEIRVEDKSVRGLVRNCGCMKAYEFHAGIELLQSDSIDERGLADAIRRRTVGHLIRAKVN
jgi:signal transduction histidine kinase